MLIVVLAALQFRTEPWSETGQDWRGHLDRVEQALHSGNVRGAEDIWRTAHVAAVRSQNWQALIEVGQAAHSIGKATGNRSDAAARARSSFLPAFFRAREVGSREGLLAAAEAFAALGDLDVAQHILRKVPVVSSATGGASLSVRRRPSSPRPHTQPSGMPDM